MPPTLEIYIKDIQICIVNKNLYDINIESILYKKSLSKKYNCYIVKLD